MPICGGRRFRSDPDRIPRHAVIFSRGKISPKHGIQKTMSVKTSELRLKLRGDTQIENITKRVADVVGGSGIKAGIVVVFIKHTTAAVMIVEDEPGIRAD